jgi:hypothetical protein
MRLCAILSPLYNAIMRNSLLRYALFSPLYNAIMRNTLFSLCAVLSYVMRLCVIASGTPATIHSGDDPLRRRVYVA